MALLLLMVTLTIYGHLVLGLLEVLLVIFRIVMLKYRMLYLTCAIGLILLGISIGAYNNQKNDKLSNESLISIIRVNPNNIKINGNSFSGKVLIRGHNINFYGFFENKSQKELVELSNDPFIMHIEGKLNSIDEPTNVNQFNLKQYFYRQKIFQSLKITKIYQVKKTPSIGIIEKIIKFRMKFNHWCQKLPPTMRTYCKGLIVGVKEPDFYDELVGIKKLGLLHLFSISGFHVYYFLNLLKKLLSKCNNLLSSLLQVLFLLIYYIFAGESPGLFRATVMALLLIMSRQLGYSLSKVDAWSLTLIINLLILPTALLLFSNQLSYLLSFGLLVTGDKNYFKQTICLNLLTLPLIIFNIYEWHILGLMITIILMPFFEKVVFPYLFVSILLANINISKLIILEYPLKLFNDTLNEISSLPGEIVFGKPCLVIICVLITLTLLIILFDKSKYVICLFLVYFGTYIFIHYPVTGEVTTFDVGQGDSFLIRTPFNRNVTIIDTGGKLKFTNEKWAKGYQNYNANFTSINYLKSIGIRQIDNLCLSHQDADHSEDVVAFIDKMKINNLVIPMGMQKNQAFKNRITKLSSNTKVLPVNDTYMINKMPLKIYHPFTSGLGENKDSMVLGGNFGQLNWLFMGDLDQKGELQIINKYPNLKTDVLKVGHHGSKTSSNPKFVRQVNPDYGIISAGKNNRYHHPNQPTIDTLNQLHIRILNTQKSGMIQYLYKNNQYGIFKKTK